MENKVNISSRQTKKIHVLNTFRIHSLKICRTVANVYYSLYRLFMQIISDKWFQFFNCFDDVQLNRHGAFCSKKAKLFYFFFASVRRSFL